MGPLYSISLPEWFKYAIQDPDRGIWVHPDLYLRNHARIAFNAKKNGTTVLLVDGERTALVRCQDGVKFDIRKGVSYAVLRWLGKGGNDIWNDFQSFTYIKTTHEGRKKQRVIFSEDFLKYLIVNGYELTQDELDSLYRKVLNPEFNDPEQLFLDLLLTKKFDISLETIDKLINEAQEHKTTKKAKCKTKKESKK